MTKYFIILLLSTMLFAETINQTDIDIEIQKIRNADASERVKLMNAFKQKVAQMNQKERINAIKSIQKSMTSNVSPNTVDTQKNQTRQTEVNDNIMSYQKMNQQHIQEQVPHQDIESGISSTFHPKISR